MMAEKSNNAGTAPSDQPPTSDNCDATWKRVQIERACEKADLQHLVRLAESHGGLLDDNLRQLACETYSLPACDASPVANARLRASSASMLAHFKGG